MDPNDLRDSFEDDMGKLYTMNKAGDIIAQCTLLIGSRVTLGADAYIIALSAACLVGDVKAIQTFLHHFLTTEHPNALNPGQQRRILQLLRGSPVADEAWTFYQAARRGGKPFKDLNVFYLLLQCPLEASQALQIFQDLVNQAIRLTAPFYLYILEHLTEEENVPHQVLRHMAGRNVDLNALAIECPEESLRVWRVLLFYGLSIKPDTYKVVKDQIGPKEIMLFLTLRPRMQLQEAEFTASVLRRIREDRSNVMISAWVIFRDASATPHNLVLHAILDGLAAEGDSRTFDVFYEMRPSVVPDVPMLRAVLHVAAHVRSCRIAKSIWREIQGIEAVPDSTMVLHLIRACLLDPNGMAEMYRVMRLSGLDIPSEAEGWVVEAYQNSTEHAALIPSVRDEFAAARGNEPIRTTVAPWPPVASVPDPSAEMM